MSEFKNPFEGVDLRPIARRKYVGQTEAFKKLEEQIDLCMNQVILGPKGIGKTDFLKSFFSRSRCKALAEESQILVYSFTYPTVLEDKDEIFGCFADAVRKAVFLADWDEELKHSIDEAVRHHQEEHTSQQSFLEDLCNRYYEHNYIVYLVIDQFESFINSPHTNVVHYDVVRNLLMNTSGSALRMVVATDYDLNQTTVPANVSGSFLPQCFSGSEIPLAPLNREESELYLLSISREPLFTSGEIDKLYQLSGGIPALLRICACCALRYKNSRELDSAGWQTVYTEALEAAGPLMAQWTKILTDRQARLLIWLSEQKGVAVVPADLRDDCFTLLINRGLICTQNCRAYTAFLNSALFRRYCREHPPQEHLPGEARESENNTIYIDNRGGSLTVDRHTENIDNHTEHTVTNTIVIPPTRELLQMLTQSGSQSFAELLYGRMSLGLPRNGLTGLGNLEALPADESASLQDHAFEEQVSSKVVSEVTVDDSGELEDVSEHELDTLELRFAEVRSKCHPELTDEQLRLLSERTRFYLKLAVVVEDALSVLKNMKQMDYSAQLVLYGKALEQELRDSLYPLFHKEQVLCRYEIPVSGRGRIPFGNTTQKDTSIGNYVYTLRDNSEYLSKLCAGRNLSSGTQRPEKSDFWNRLSNATNRVLSIRNKAAHPEITTLEDVNDIAAECFGKDADSIFSMCQTGKALYAALFGSELSFAECKELENTEAVFTCTRVNPNCGCSGSLENGALVKISPKKREKYRNDSGYSIEVGTKCVVKLAEFREQNGALFFAAIPLRPI